MADLSLVPALLVSIKNASDIVKSLRSASVSLEDAEHKLQLANLIESLAEAKMNAAEIQDVIREKDEEIKRLNEALTLKAKVKKFGEAYFEVDSDETPIGDPYCLHCWEVSNKLVHLHRPIKFYNPICSLCKNSYSKIARRPQAVDT